MLQKRLKVKDIDLLDAYKKKKEPSKYASVLKYAIPPIILALVVVGFFGFITFKNNSLQGDIADMNVKIKELEKKMAEDPNLPKFNTLTSIIMNTKKYKTLYEDIQSYPQLSQVIFDQLIISGNGTLSITGFNFTRESQTISINIETSNESNTEGFVRNLKASGTFADVSYTGYMGSEKTEDTITTDDSVLSGLLGTTAKKESTKTGEIVYTATVLCLLK
ncbi:hypothetical protein ACWG0P_13435 [Amedibacillus sp. YH-ame6]